MLSQLAEGLLHFETCDKPKHLRAVVDASVAGCSFIVRTDTVPLMKTFNAVFPDGQIPINVSLCEAFVEDDPYWLLCYMFGCKNFYAWVLQSKSSEAELKKHGNFIFDSSVRTVTNANWGYTKGEPEIQEIMGMYLENNIPGIRILEYGELPNGILASFLVTDPDQIARTFLDSKSTSSVSVGCEMLEVQHKQKSKPVNAKIKAKQEKRQKNWNRAKKGNADS